MDLLLYRHVLDTLCHAVAQHFRFAFAVLTHITYVVTVMPYVIVSVPEIARVEGVSHGKKTGRIVGIAT